MHIKWATSSNFAQIMTIWGNAVRATHDFLPEKMITTLRPLILHNYLPNIDVYNQLTSKTISPVLWGLKKIG
ncbi:MAG: hypothetical protein AB8W37_04495 [Arsenophonus endosymbiont of Dermacentor nuttalli]